MSDPKTSIASYTASGSLILFGLTANDFAVLSGRYYKHMRIIEQQVKRMPFPKIDLEEQ